MHLYHITPKENLHNIYTQGLYPAKAKGIGVHVKLPYVFLTDKPDTILYQQTSKRWMERYDPYILTVWAPNAKLFCEDEYIIDHVPLANIYDCRKAPRYEILEELFVFDRLR